MPGIIETLILLGNHRILIRLIKIADLPETLDTEGPFTVFAPIDDAFNELPEETLDSLLAGGQELIKVLNNHIVLGESTTEDLEANPYLETQSGGKISLDILDDTLMANEAAIVQPDISFDGGLIQVIDAVLMPEG